MMTHHGQGGEKLERGGQVLAVLLEGLSVQAKDEIMGLGER